VNFVFKCLRSCTVVVLKVCYRCSRFGCCFSLNCVPKIAMHLFSKGLLTWPSSLSPGSQALASCSALRSREEQVRRLCLILNCLHGCTFVLLMLRVV
jgi:hypothetical protein